MFLPFPIADSPIALVLNMAVEQVPRLGHRLNSGSVIEDTGLESAAWARIPGWCSLVCRSLHLFVPWFPCEYNGVSRTIRGCGKD